MTGGLKFADTSGGHPIQTPCSGRNTWIMFTKTMSRQLLCICKDGYSIISLGNLCHRLVTFTSDKIVSWCSEGASCISVCDHCLSSCHQAPLGSLLFAPSLQNCVLMRWSWAPLFWKHRKWDLLNKVKLYHLNDHCIISLFHQLLLCLTSCEKELVNFSSLLFFPLKVSSFFYEDI